ncbi:MAG: hypothetical protein UX72_C0040G0008 [Parcubacteria group bacterium GW2011_GWA2_47_10]|nr:MAG: hypothetical protein UX72_C0040G0008 [Parcubacteria group bacterium GW2011_GWA2_47_10]
MSIPLEVKKYPQFLVRLKAKVAYALSIFLAQVNFRLLAGSIVRVDAKTIVLPEYV